MKIFPEAPRARARRVKIYVLAGVLIFYQKPIRDFSSWFFGAEYRQLKNWLDTKKDSAESEKGSEESSLKSNES
ncbi:hypothetical protein EB796_024452 [Bugula neritina]|uniref:Uncharacterized protein n=1 Tax=Bugula neritina TaxID=10212 RepID=A0A7J7ITJ0_BUGNE|nr:hypothetical protein EB796_024452 [Bugula neritina]